MEKEDMIRQILNNFVHDSFYCMSPAELDRKLKNDHTYLSEITYSEVEELYYMGSPKSSLF